MPFSLIRLKNESRVETNSVIFWRSYFEFIITDSHYNEILNEFEKENVTRVTNVHGTLDHQIIATDYNFINNGVPINMHDYSTLVYTQEIELLYGETWDEFETEKVMVIDEATALKVFNTSNAVGRVFDLEGESWTVVGVVSDTTERDYFIDYYSDRDPNTYNNDFDTYIYVPYSFVGHNTFDNQDESIDYIIVQAENIFKTNTVKDKVLDILVNGENVMSNMDSDRYLIIGNTTPLEFLSSNLSIFGNLLLILSVDVLLLLGIYIRVRYKEMAVTSIKEFNEEDIEKLLLLEVEESQKTYVSSIDKSIDNHLNKEIETIMYTIYKDTELIGYCLVKINESIENAFIWQFVIEKDSQENRHGFKAMKLILNKLKKFNFHTITTTTKLDNKVARNFFEKIGFYAISEEEDELNYRLN